MAAGERGEGGCTRRGAAVLAAPVLAVMALGAPAAAQVAPGPGVQVPIDRRSPLSQATPTREQVETQPPAADRARPRIDVVDALPDAPCPESLERSAVRVTLREIRFEAASGGVLAPVLAEVLAPVARTEAGERPVKDVCEIRNRANQALYAAGYVASAQIPAQEIADGVLRLQIVSAKITEVRIAGVDGAVGKAVADRVDAIRLIDPLNRRDAERILLLANDVPGLGLGLTLQPAGTGPGNVIAVVTVDQQPGLILVNYQNSGSRQLGPSIFSLRTEAYGLTGLADRTYVGVSQSAQWDEVHVVQAGHDFGIGADNFRIGLRGSFAKSRPDIPDLDLRSRSLIAALDLSAPLYRARERNGRTLDDVNVFASGGLELLNQRTVIRGAGGSSPFTRDRLRMLYALFGARVVSRDAYGVVRNDVDATLEFRRGVDILDASRRGAVQDGFQPSRLAGDPEAFKIRGAITQTVRPFARLDALAFDLSTFGQWANRPLLNLEEFTVGNLTYGRGYDPGANAGDRAVAVRIRPRLRVTAPEAAMQVELTGFYDGVRFWNRDPGTSERDRVLESVGGGLRLTLPGRMAFEVEYARPLDRALTTDARRPRERVLVSFTAQLVPWRFGR